MNQAEARRVVWAKIAEELAKEGAYDLFVGERQRIEPLEADQRRLVKAFRSIAAFAKKQATTLAKCGKTAPLRDGTMLSCTRRPKHREACLDETRKPPCIFDPD